MKIIPEAGVSFGTTSHAISALGAAAAAAGGPNDKVSLSQRKLALELVKSSFIFRLIKNLGIIYLQLYMKNPLVIQTTRQSHIHTEENFLCTLDGD